MADLPDTWNLNQPLDSVTGDLSTPGDGSANGLLTGYQKLQAWLGLSPTGSTAKGTGTGLGSDAWKQIGAAGLNALKSAQTDPKLTPPGSSAYRPTGGSAALQQLIDMEMRRRQAMRTAYMNGPGSAFNAAISDGGHEGGKESETFERRGDSGPGGLLG